VITFKFSTQFLSIKPLLKLDKRFFCRLTNNNFNLSNGNDGREVHPMQSEQQWLEPQWLLLF